MNNTQFYNGIKAALLPLLGQYQKSQGLEPAIAYDSGKREQQVVGLEIIVEPLCYGKIRVGNQRTDSTAHSVHLIQHEGRRTIGQAADRLYQFTVDEGAANFMSRALNPDFAQDILPAQLWTIWFVKEDCCEEIC